MTSPPGSSAGGVAARAGRPLRTWAAALWSARTWRSVAQVFAGLPLVALASLAFVVVPGSLVLSLAWEVQALPDPHWWDAAFYVLAVLATPIWLRWVIQLFSAAHRSRFATVAGLRLAPPAPTAGLRAYWRAASTWRQLVYHLLTLVVVPVGASGIAAAWCGGIALVVATRSPFAVLPAIVLLLLAPVLSQDAAAIDAFLARRLLGPSASEELALRVAAMARSRADVVEAADAQRRRIERDLHDGAQQRLVSLAMNLGMARANLTDLPEPARKVIAEAHDEAKQALVELRQLVRGLHPAVLADRGLDAALSGLAARAPLPVRLRVDVAQRCSPTVEAVAYFIISEALTNVAKHAEAARAEVTVERSGQRLRIVVTDDGRGGIPLDPGPGGGLRGLVQRAAAVDGTLTIASPSGGPTILTAELPCGS